MSYRIPNEGPVPERFLPRLRNIADLHGASVERLVETIRARRRFVRARMFRQRSRRRRLTMNPKAKKRVLLNGQATYSGQGEVAQLLQQLNWTQAAFCEYCGIHPSAFTRWRGHPLARWPIRMLELMLRMRKMEAWLKTKNYNGEWINEHFGPIELPRMPTGRYPRKQGQLLIDGKPVTDWSPWQP